MKYVFLLTCAAVAAAAAHQGACCSAASAAEHTANVSSAYQRPAEHAGTGSTGHESRAILESFQRFCKKWFLEKQNICREKSISCKKTHTACVAEYTRSSGHYNAHIKKTKEQDAPYIGILKYRETLYNCTAQTCEEASAGPFTRLSEYPVSEIFLYRDGRWQY